MSRKAMLFAFLMLWAYAGFGAQEEQFEANVQCTARGFRQTGGWGVLVNSQLYLNIKIDDEGKAELGYVGHVSLGFEDEQNPEFSRMSYYGQYNGKTRNVLSSEARVYTDDKFFRFNWVNAKLTSSYDGGGIYGYLVVSKMVQDDHANIFFAHYVMKAGKHMGGTIDYVCLRGL